MSDRTLSAKTASLNRQRIRKDLSQLQDIHGTPYATSAPIEHMGVDHRHRDRVRTKSRAKDQEMEASRRGKVGTPMA